MWKIIAALVAFGFLAWLLWGTEMTFVQTVLLGCFIGADYISERLSR